MRIADVDTSAVLGTSALHGVAPRAKLVAFVLTLAAIVVNQNVLVIAAILLMLVALVVAMRLPARTALPLAAYPAIFAGVFALASAPDILTAALIILKATTAALAAVVLMLTTPYPQVFAAVQRVAPGIVGDALLMTYRSLFLLLEKLGNLLRAIRLRSGLSGRQPVRAARAASQALGSLVLYTFDLAQREYDVMRLRGYEGRLRVTPTPSARPAVDAVLLTIATAVFAAAAAWRLYWVSLNDYSWLLTALAIVALAVALLGRIRRNR